MIQAGAAKANFIPALVSGNATEYLRIVLSLTDLGLEQMGHKRLQLGSSSFTEARDCSGAEFNVFPCS